MKEWMKALAMKSFKLNLPYMLSDKYLINMGMNCNLLTHLGALFGSISITARDNENTKSQLQRVKVKLSTGS